MIYYTCRCLHLQGIHKRTSLRYFTGTDRVTNTALQDKGCISSCLFILLHCWPEVDTAIAEIEYFFILPLRCIVHTMQCDSCIVCNTLEQTWPTVVHFEDNVIYFCRNTKKTCGGVMYPVFHVNLFCLEDVSTYMYNSEVRECSGQYYSRYQWMVRGEQHSEHLDPHLVKNTSSHHTQ